MVGIGTLSACALWKEPDVTLAKGLQDQFELVETFGKESHWWRYLLKCRDCGQLYVYDFYETIDWDSGEDPQFVTWVPVDTDVEIKAVDAAPPGRLSEFTPRLCKDWPKGQDKPSLFWVLPTEGAIGSALQIRSTPRASDDHQ